jgi:hypothetical protein
VISISEEWMRGGKEEGRKEGKRRRRRGGEGDKERIPSINILKQAPQKHLSTQNPETLQQNPKNKNLLNFKCKKKLSNSEKFSKI